MSWDLVGDVRGPDGGWAARAAAAAALMATRAVYVGWREPRRDDACAQLLDGPLAVPRLHILEPWLPNVEAAYQCWRGDERVNVETSTVQEFMELGRLRQTDLVVWQHGPEHLELDAARHLLTEMQRALPRGIVVEAPNGEYPQGSIGNNPHERHLSTWAPMTFGMLGFETALSLEGEYVIGIWRPE